MKAKIVTIGNSRGIRIPKPLLELTGIGDEVEIEVQAGALVIRPAAAPRTGWDDAFRSMAAAGDDQLLDGAQLPPTRWDDEQWEW